MKKIKYHIILFLLRAVSLLPLWLLYRLSDFMFIVVFYLIGYRRKTVRQNLANALPQRSETERKEIERKFYRHLCDLIVETIKLFTMSDTALKQRVKTVNPEWIEELSQDGKSIILFMGHYGNWEWVPTITFHYKRPALSGQIYRPLHDKVMDKIFLLLRGRFGNLSIPQQQAYRTLIKLHSEGRQNLIAFIADQRPNTDVLPHWTWFLHQETAFSTGGEKIGRKTHSHFVYLEVEKPCRGHYKLTFKPIVPQDFQAEYPYTEEFMKMLQATIERTPELWLWSHKRWRFNRESQQIHQKNK